jgi:Ca2+-binding EF-hand superfamily protein
MVQIRGVHSNPYLIQGSITASPTEGSRESTATVSHHWLKDEVRRREREVENKGVFIRIYIKIGNFIFGQIHHEGFTAIEAMSIINVCTMFLFVAWDVQYYTSAKVDNRDPPLMLSIGRWTNTAVFYMEFTARVVSEGRTPSMIFQRSDRMWRILDVVNLVVNSTIGPISVYRVLVGFKIVEYIIQDSPKMRVLFYSIIHGMKRLLGLCCFIFFVAYLYAVLGLYLFRESNPFHFGTMARAFSSVSVAATFEDWSEMFYTCYYGCAVYAHSIYSDQPIDSVCDEDVPQPDKVYTAVYFISYICISVFLLSLFVSTLTLQLAQAYKDVKTELRRTKARQQASLVGLLDIILMMSTKRSSKRRRSWWEYDRAIMSIEHINLRLETALLLRGAFESDMCEENKRACYESMKVTARHDFVIAQLFYKVFKFSQKVNESKMVRTALACLILLNAVFLGVFTEYLKEFEYAWSIFVGSVFMLELFCKLAGEGFRPWRYFLVTCGDIPRSVRIDRVFDAFIIVMGWAVTPISFVNRLGLVGYALNSKSLRLPALTLISAAEVLLYAIFIFSWVIFTTACIGVVLFNENDPQHYGALDKAVVTQIRLTTLDDWSDVWLMNQLGCDKYLNDMLPEDCVSPLPQPIVAGVFFPVYILLTSYIGMNLLTAIVVTSNEDVVDELTKASENRERVSDIQDQFQLTSSQIKRTKDIFNLLDFDGSKELGIIELQLALDQAHVSLTRQSVVRMMRHIDPQWKASEGRGVNFPSFLRFFMSISECRGSTQPTLPELLAGFKIIDVLRRRVKARKHKYDAAVTDHLVSGERFYREFLSAHRETKNIAMRQAMQKEIAKHEASRSKLFSLARGNDCKEMRAMEDATKGLVSRWQLQSSGTDYFRKAMLFGDVTQMREMAALLLQRRWRGWLVRQKLKLLLKHDVIAPNLIQMAPGASASEVRLPLPVVSTSPQSSPTDAVQISDSSDADVLQGGHHRFLI